MFIVAFFVAFSVVFSATFAVAFLFRWFGTTPAPESEVAPGWGWAYYTTGICIPSMVGTAVCAIGEALLKKVIKQDAIAGSGILCGVSQMFAVPAFIMGWPTMLWWGLYLA